MARELKPCGTTAAYRRHLRKRQTPCKACLAASRDEKRAQRAASLEAEVPPPDEAPARERLAELRWQAELLRRSIIWAATHSPARLPSLSKERRETLEEIEELADGAEDSGGGALGDFLSGPGPLALVGGADTQDRKEA
ncbi:hypothetical protein [Brachybacterium squillarum]|uniref:hypothetical protein n=1 Tax=Brachybacterium squillarum TaxID=661979 RepID=UPI0022232030|nr:hypothetical protein [Brachybacterium squillarum]MCW1803864.1 hypothetical protein [Brachybacterium squillarum]